jgi:hypothetical protein
MGKYTPLPYEGLFDGHPNWPDKDWQAFFVCGRCNEGRTCTRKSVRWIMTDRIRPARWNQTSLVQVELRCAGKRMSRADPDPSSS